MKQRDLKLLTDFQAMRPEGLPPPDYTRGDALGLILKFVALYLGLALVLALLIVFAPAIIQTVRAVWP